MARTQGSHSDITGPRIRKAALGLFARHGYAAVSMRQIAKEVGVQAGALYNYTPDKQSLLFRLMRDHMQELQQAYDALGETGDAQEALRRFVGFHIRFHLERPDEVFIAYMELRSLDQAGQDQIVALRNRYEDGLREILEAGVQDGSFVISDAAVHARILLSMLTGVTVWYRDNGRLDRGEVVECYVVAALNSVGLNGAETLRKGG